MYIDTELIALSEPRKWLVSNNTTSWWIKIYKSRTKNQNEYYTSITNSSQWQLFQ